MVDNDVESILREIREKVLMEQQQADIDSASNNHENPQGGLEQATVQLAQLDAYLTTTARAWDQLPPIVSNRSGTAARVELWVKGCFKRLTRWFIWEQVNFNAAVHHALIHTHKALADNDQARRSSANDIEALRQQLLQRQSELEVRLREIESQLSQLRDERAGVENNIRSLSLEINNCSEQFTNRLEELLQEMRARDERLLAEQRVCLKQLAHQINEAVVLHDRTRRKVESRLDKLEKTNDPKDTT